MALDGAIQYDSREPELNGASNDKNGAEFDDVSTCNYMVGYNLNIYIYRVQKWDLIESVKMVQY